ncbi:MAG: rhodanese-like domain-containing protein [Ferruginibacter sp.]
MIYKLFAAAFLLFAASASAQYKNDNVLFKTIDPADLCPALEKNKGFLLLDVRSSGEHNDTSSSTGLNIGHLRGAKNINVRELGKRINEIADYKQRPVFVYCSHSQRSRRASKMLADSGFTNVYNINGGMTSFYYTNEREKGCLQSLLETNNRYQPVSAIDLCEKLTAKDNKIFILDVRNDSAFRHISASAQDNAYGIFSNAVHIPLAELEKNLSSVPRDKEIIVTELYGDDAAKAAALLIKNGYTKVSTLVEGIDRMLGTDDLLLPCKNKFYVSPVTYHLMNTYEFGRFTQSQKDFLLLDIRTADAFGNTHKDVFRNIGHLKNAVNIPSQEIAKHLAELNAYKNKNIIIYGFGGDDEAYIAANALTAAGFKNINVLINGLFDVRWTAANRKGMGYLKDLVTDIPEINQ